MQWHPHYGRLQAVSLLERVLRYRLRSLPSAAIRALRALHELHYGLHPGLSTKILPITVAVLERRFIIVGIVEQV